jgi:hypothetical protein
MEKMKVQYAMELHRMQLLSSRNPQGGIFIYFLFVQCCLLFCELGHTCFTVYISTPFILLSCSPILHLFLFPLLCKLSVYISFRSGFMDP